MAEYVLFTDSTTDLTPALVEELGVRVIPMVFNLNGNDYKNYPDNRELSSKDFYDALRAGSMSTTSQINQATFMDTFAPLLAEGKDVLYLGFSSGLSGTFHSATLAAADLIEEYPGRTVRVVDTLQASMGEGLLVYYAAKRMAEGASLEELAAWVEAERLHFSAWFTVDDLMFLKRGGRLSGAAAVAGTLLGIKPVLHVDNEGHLIPMAKVRGRRASLEALVKHIAQSDIPLAEQVIFVSHGDCPEETEAVVNAIKELGVARIEMGDIGPVIGAHSGPGTVAVFFRSSTR